MKAQCNIVKKICSVIFLMAMLLLCSSLLQAKQQSACETEKKRLTFSSNLRLRYEFYDNFNQKYYGERPARGKTDDGFLLGRFRAGVDWYPTDKIHIALWGQHSTCWGSALPDSAFYNNTHQFENNPNKDYWELYTTFIEVKNLFDAGLGFKIGRQLIAYGNNRVFGPGQWGNSGRYIWDAAKISWKHQRGFVDIYYGRNMLHDVQRFSLRHRHEFESIGLYARYDVLQKTFEISVEPMVFTKRDHHRRYRGEKQGYYLQPDGSRVTYRKQGALDSWYAGVRISGKNIKRFDFDATLLQERGDFAKDNLRAYGYHLMLAYNLPMRFNPRLSIEYSYASGDDNPDDGVCRTFHGAFGARDQMYGRMNLFHWMNLQDLQANIELSPASWLDIKFEFHKFMLAERKDAWYLNQQIYRDRTGSSGKSVGKEFDVVATLRLPYGNRVMAGFGRFWPDTFAKTMASNRPANWCFVQWEYRFSKGLL